MASMLEQLMELPLFKGASISRMSKIVGESKFHFLKYPAGETVFSVGDKCAHVTFVLNGRIRTTIENNNGRFAVSQTLAAPTIVRPDFLFGKTTSYPFSARAIDSVSILQISKSDFIRILDSDHVFLFNFLNMLSVDAQKGICGILSLTTAEVDQRIAYWISALTQAGGTDIRLTCRRRDLCSLFSVQRNTFDAALASMAEKGILEYNPKELHIFDRGKLLDLLETSHEDQDELQGSTDCGD